MIIIINTFLIKMIENIMTIVEMVLTQEVNVGTKIK